MVKWRGRREFEQRLKGIAANTTKEVNTALFAGGDIIRAEAQHSIVAGSISGKNHVVSLPGEPPNADTRQLDTSIITEPIRDGVVHVTANAPHSVPLEFGTSKMIERPYMRPAGKKKRPEVVALVRRAVKRATGK
jgi:HK97 gp10 family phage protein